MHVHLVDGTYELFRHYYALPSARDEDGREVAAVRGVLASVLGMISSGATHVAVATDHVIESFRNELWPGYKTGEGVEPDLLAQFPLLEDALRRPALSSGRWWSSRPTMRWLPRRMAAARDARVDQVDHLHAGQGPRPVRARHTRRPAESPHARHLDEAGVIQKFGVPPASIPDYLALVGDAADGYPGLRGWGAKSSAAVLARFVHLESIPARLARVARERRERE